MGRKELPASLFDSTGQALSKMPDEIRPSTNGAIFNEKGEVLLQKRADNGYWGLPGWQGRYWRVGGTRGDTRGPGRDRTPCDYKTLNRSILRPPALFDNELSLCGMDYPLRHPAL